MAKVCPQRIIKEAIRIIEEYAYSAEGIANLDGAEVEAIANNLLELDDLQRKLYQMGIINV